MDTGIALQEFLEYVLHGLVQKPEHIVIRHEISGGKHIYNIGIDGEDVGCVIGRNGHMLSAIRSLAKAAAARDGINVRLRVYQIGGEKDGERVA